MRWCERSALAYSRAHVRVPSRREMPRFRSGPLSMPIGLRLPNGLRASASASAQKTGRLRPVALDTACVLAAVARLCTFMLIYLKL